jgi:hypothetical protein
MTLSPASNEQLLRRLIDARHVERERQRPFLSEAVLRDTRLALALRSVTDLLGHPPSTPEYIAAYKVARGRGDASLPSVSVFVKRHGSWRAALFAAGLTGTPPQGLIHQRRLLRARPAVYPRERVVACIRACAAEVGRVPTVLDYAAWRDEKAQVARASGRSHPDFPHYNTIRRRYGGWPQALNAAGFSGRLDRRNPPAWWTPLQTELPPPTG